MLIEYILLNIINIHYFIHYLSKFLYIKFHSFIKNKLFIRLLDLSLVWFKQHSSTTENNKTTPTSSNEKPSDTCDIFRDGCKTIMSILVILTNDCG